MPPVFGRRTLLQTLALMSAAAQSRAVLAGEEPIAYLAANGVGKDEFRLAAMDQHGAILREWPLPARGHGMATVPGKAQAIIFARRPGYYALHIDVASGAILAKIEAAPDRHFEGHGLVTPDGTRLYATESAHDDGRGLLGLYDLTRGGRRIGEIPTHGLGPHAILPLPNWQGLVVANGGILTLPQSGRDKLNIADMRPSLAIISPKDGALLSQREPPTDLQQLSIRHLALAPDGGVAIALQYEGAADDPVPLVALAEPDGSPLRFLDAPETVRMRMQQYCGDVAMTADGSRFAVSSPRGGLITLWARDGRFSGTVALADGCGLAAAAEGTGLVATSGFGDMLRLDDAQKLVHSPRAWDNHLIGLG